ncbi:MAG: hypothetical protein R2879_19070 [Saprospiraceae bacterium]
MSELENYINTYFGINPAHLKAMADLLKAHFKKEEYFTEVGKRVTFEFYSFKHLRVFNYSDGKEVTQWLASPGEFGS